MIVFLQEEEKMNQTKNIETLEEEGLEEDFQIPESQEWIRFAAEYGDPKVIYRRGVNHLFGKNSYKQDIKLGLKYIHIAAENRCAMAQRQLGIIYEQGLFGSKDIAKAHDWYLIASKNGDNYSQYRLANIYYTGFSGEKNVIQSYAWADAAANGGKAEAIFLREKIAAELNPEQLTQAQNLSKQYATMARKSNE